MKVNFYTFAKRINSTKQPTGTGTEYDVIIKRGSSIISPTIELDAGLATSPAALNYAYISDWGRYYFVSDWVFNERLWTAKLSVDPLASFKTSIGAYHGYVLRAASSYDTRIVDTLYPGKAQNTHESDAATSPFLDSQTAPNGYFILGCQGDQAAGNGGSVTYYRAEPGAIQGLINAFLSNPSQYGQSDISDDLLKCIFNPLQYMVSCMWIPFKPPATTGDVGFGWWSFSNANIVPISQLEYGTNISFQIPKHPKAATRGEYLNLPPFAKYKLEAGPWGIIPLDGFNLLDATQLDCNWKVDLMTGSGRFDIKFRDKLCYEQSITAQIGVPVQIGQNVLNQGAISGILEHTQNIGRSLFTGRISDVVSEGIGAIGDAAALGVAVPSTIGSNGTRSFNNLFALMADFMDITDEDIASRGRPLCKAVTLSTLTGFILCSDADPEIACTDNEDAMIRSYLNGGFYYE